MKVTSSNRIIFFIGTLGNGGAERVISILTHHFSEKDIPVEIVLYYDEEPFYKIHPNVKITYVERETGSKNILKNIVWMRRYFKSNAEVIVSFLAQFNMLVLIALFATSIPIVVADRNDPRHMPKQNILRTVRNILYCLADVVVVQTQHNKSYFSSSLQKKCKIIYNPVDIQDKKGLALQTDKQHRIVSVARLMKQKNQLMMIDAFAQIKKEYPSYTLTIYGEGPFREELEKRIAELELSNSVLLPGRTQKVFESIADAELFVLSSDFEGMPNALIEAMCLGLPVISTKVSGATDLIQHEHNGLLVDVGDTEQMVEAMRRMISDSELSMKCAKNALDINDKLDVNNIIKEWLKCLETI